MKKETVVNILKHSILFTKLGPNQLKAAADICKVRYLDEGEYIYRQGEPGEGFYLVGVGEVELILSRNDGSESVVGRIGLGGHFGETSLLTGKPHALSARAACDVALICYDKRLFREALLGDNLIHQQLNLALAERLRVSFQDQADTASTVTKMSVISDQLEEHYLFHDDPDDNPVEEPRPSTSSTVRRMQAVSRTFSKNLEPVLLTGESGTGKKFLAKQIHLQSSYAQGPYIEIELRDYEEEEDVAENLFGTPGGSFPFAQARQSGIFEQFAKGTVVLLHAERLSYPVQQKIIRAISSGSYQRLGSAEFTAMQTRIICICDEELEVLHKNDHFLPGFLAILQAQHYRVPSLREHKRDLPRLIEHFLSRYSREYGKNVLTISPDTMGLLMNYDWPGNLPELQSVIQRAVMLSRQNQILSDQIILGLPKTEGKWEFNILRIPAVRAFLRSRKYPLIPKIIVGIVLLVTVIALLFGPAEAGRNIGITLSWAIGWPLLFFSFFFLARTWCSVCTLAVPGKIVQTILKPERATPAFIKNSAGWIMALLCILVLWVELVWDAYQNPLLTASIILAVSAGSFIFSIFYSRRVWCRHLCPLGAINAIFAMPAVLELRSNKHLCLNRCREHACFCGDDSLDGCPMFRHPFLVDNNRDCIMCANCIKNCNNSSIHLNLRLTPEELWDLNTPRRADSFLIVSLGAIFFPFVLHHEYTSFFRDAFAMVFSFAARLPSFVVDSIAFFGLILLFQVGYISMVSLVAHYAGVARKALLPMLGYGFIPLILGCYLALHLGLFVDNAWRIWPNLMEILGLQANYEPWRVLSEDSTSVLQTITVIGGMLASFYAIYRIMARFKDEKAFASEALVLPYSFMIVLGGLSLYLI